MRRNTTCPKANPTCACALCEGAIFIGLAQVLSYLKLFELPQGGSVTIEMLPIFLYCARWGFGPGMLASFAYSILQAVLSSTYAWTWQSLIGDYLLAFTVRCCGSR